VAISLNKRDQMPLTVGIALWEVYMRSALQHSQGMPRIVVDYNALLQDPERGIQALHEKLIEQGLEVFAITGEILGFIDSSLYRSRKQDLTAASLLNGKQAELYEQLCAGRLESGGGVVSAGGLEVLELYEKAFPVMPRWKRKWSRLSKRFSRN
jgi:hypothetical protein